MEDASSATRFDFRYYLGGVNGYNRDLTYVDKVFQLVQDGLDIKFEPRAPAPYISVADEEQMAFNFHLTANMDSWDAATSCDYADRLQQPIRESFSNLLAHVGVDCSATR